MDGYPARVNDGAIVQSTRTPLHRASLTQAILDRATTGLIGLDAGRCVVFCNHVAAEMLGLAAPEMWHPVPIGEILAHSTKLDGAGRLALEAVFRSGAAPDCPDRRKAGDRQEKIALAACRARLVV